MNIDSMKWDIVGSRKVWFTLSSVIIILGLIFMVRNAVTDKDFHSPLKLGIDFAGGEILQLKFNADDVDLDKIGSETIYQIVDSVTVKSPQVQISQMENAKTQRGGFIRYRRSETGFPRYLHGLTRFRHPDILVLDPVTVDVGFFAILLKQGTNGIISGDLTEIGHSPHDMLLVDAATIPATRVIAFGLLKIMKEMGLRIPTG